MHMVSIGSFACAYFLDLALGDPRSWPHPVRWIGAVVSRIEVLVYGDTVRAGILHWVLVVGIVLGSFFSAMACLESVHPALAVLGQVYVVFTGLATRSLHRECALVERCLTRGDVPGARIMLSRVVGRQTAHLDEPAIRRALLETMAENLSDGVVAPLFFLACFGLPGLVFCKTVNTLDSMVGYKNERYLHFGRAAARIDDVVNWGPARVTGGLLVLGAACLGLPWRRAVQTMLRDGGKAASPNAGVPEAALAGALGVRLGGASVYFGQNVDKPWIGGEGTDPGTVEYRRTVRLLYLVSLAAAGLTAVALTVSGHGLVGPLFGAGW
jgi:adenosylcobinamide-phosphate synthase